MIEEHVLVPEGWTLQDVEGWMASVEGLGFQYMGSSRSIPGAHHWHLRSDHGSGVVDCTLSPAHGRVVLAVHSNRAGTWAGEALPQLAAALRRYAGVAP